MIHFYSWRKTIHGRRIYQPCRQPAVRRLLHPREYSNKWKDVTCPVCLKKKPE